MLRYFCCFIFLFLFSSNTIFKVSLAENNYFTSAIVVNSNNGKILYSYNADEKIYPASLTKLMTAYVVFDNIKKGVIGMNDKIDKKTYNSKKLENIFPYSSNITIKDLLLKMIVNSLNTPSEILALEVYGNTKTFINEMNKKAKQFGMSNTHFVNTHGLFNEKHYSTARDLANISIRIVNDFPEYAELFNITEYINSSEDLEEKTSTIQKNIKGVKGSKTGYINASGYNIAMWGDYENTEGKKKTTEHIFAVLIGAKTKQDRDNLMLKLLSSTMKNNFSKTTNINNNDKNYNNEIANILTFVGLKPENYLSNKPKMRSHNKNYTFENSTYQDEDGEYIDFTLPQDNKNANDTFYDNEKRNLSDMIDVRDKQDTLKKNIIEQNDDIIEDEDEDNNEVLSFDNNKNDNNKKSKDNFNFSVKQKNRFYIAK